MRYINTITITKKTTTKHNSVYFDIHVVNVSN